MPKLRPLDRKLQLFLPVAEDVRFCLNDFGSILENIERMGYGAIIPAPIRKMLKAMEERSEAMASDVVSGGEIHRQHRDE